MVRRLTTAFTLISIFCIAFQVIAQDKKKLEQGIKIRLELSKDNNKYIGKYFGIEEDQVRLFSIDQEKELLLPVNNVRYLEIFIEKGRLSRFGSGWRRGSIIGGSIFAVGFGIAGISEFSGEGGLTVYPILSYCLSGAIVGWLTGGFIGSIVYLNREIGEWEAQPIDILTKGKIQPSIGITLFRFSFSKNN
ncbi:MAG: hypothetical protein GY863_10720 [bacterium]|nr:hypothetical protein [bacterium]